MEETMNTFDVFIIGGGLAGLNSGRRLLSETSLQIGLTEIPRPKENNPARITFKDTVLNYDLSDSILAEYTSFGEFSYHGARTIHKFHDKQFVSLDYNKACTRILNLLKLGKNFYYYTKKVSGIEVLDNFVIIHFYTGDKVKTKLLIDASGTSHLVLNKYNLPKPSLYSHSFGRSFIGCCNENIDEAYFIASSVDYGSGGGWYYPINRDRTSVGFAMITNTPSSPTKEIKEKFLKAIHEVSPINRYLAEAQPQQYETGAIPIQRAKNFYRDRMLIVGDAAGQATPWTCMGVEPALKSSDLVVDTVKEAFRKNDFSLVLLSRYQTIWEEENKIAYDIMDNFKVKMWFWGEDVWDFIIEKDLNNLTPEQFLKRIRYNEKNFETKMITLLKWGSFRIKHFRERKKYKQHKTTHY